MRTVVAGAVGIRDFDAVDLAIVDESGKKPISSRASLPAREKGVTVERSGIAKRPPLEPRSVMVIPEM